MYYKLPIKERMDLMKSYKKANPDMSYRDMVNDYNDSYEKFKDGGTKNKPKIDFEGSRRKPTNYFPKSQAEAQEMLDEQKKPGYKKPDNTEYYREKAYRNKDQGTVKEYIPQSKISKTLEVAANPLPAMKNYIATGRVPDHFSQDAEESMLSPTGVANMAYQGLTGIGRVAGMANAGYNVPVDLAQGNYLSAGLNALDALPGIPGNIKNLTPAYNKVATGNSLLPYAWKSPANKLSQKESSSIYNKIKGGENLSEQEKVLLAEYQYNSRPFTGRGDALDIDKKQQILKLIKNNPSVFTDNTILTRRIDPTNKELFNIKNKIIDFKDRPTSFSAGIGVDTYGSNAKDRIVISGKNAKKMQDYFLKNNYSNISDETYSNIDKFTTIKDAAFTGKDQLFSNGSKIRAFDEGFIKDLKKAEIEKEIIGQNLKFKRIGKVKNDLGGYDHIVKSKK